jgi:hypothetical protein
LRTQAPFQKDDLADLDRLLDKALAVVSMAEVHAGATDTRIIGMRHDVDNDITPAVEMALWEQERGYRSTYYILHTAPYWDDDRLLADSLETIAGAGHEIGIHNNALAEAARTGGSPHVMLENAIVKLRRLGYEIRSTVAHGDHGCYGDDGKVAFVNDQLFAECPRPQYEPVCQPEPLSYFGLDFDANWLPRNGYLSDSGGVWSGPFRLYAQGFPFSGQLHMLVHPDWWGEAFERVEVPA